MLGPHIINTPEDLKKRIQRHNLPSLCTELRHFLVESLLKTGGHLGASLGVVELTTALHYCFNSPIDKIIWDTGHQAYVHKILTGRRHQIQTIRQRDGISGFTSMSESPHDAFGAGHSSTAISAGLGISTAYFLESQANQAKQGTSAGPRYTISVIGDGGLSAGIALEAMNNFHSCRKAISGQARHITILNDNGMFISPAVGGVSEYLKSLCARPFVSTKEAEAFCANPTNWASSHYKEKEALSQLFGCSYFGVVDGHDVLSLVKLFELIKASDKADMYPILIHIKTEKGHGCHLSHNSHDKLHAVAPGHGTVSSQPKVQTLSNSDLVSNTLFTIAKKDPSITVITPAMMLGSRLQQFSKEMPERFFDTGIAEQHSAVFAAGMAASGSVRPFLFIYSTFLQRAYDQIIHDIALQGLPVRLFIDRAGITGEDGATHAGIFDAAFLRAIPGITICQPSHGHDIEQAVHFAHSFNSGPIAVRYSKQKVFYVEEGQGNKQKEGHRQAAIHQGEGGAKVTLTPWATGRGSIIHQGTEDLAIITIGSILEEVLLMRKQAPFAQNCTVVDARFIKPIDTELITNTIKSHKKTVILEEVITGGLLSAILEHLSSTQQGQSSLISKIIPITLPDAFPPHGSIAEVRRLLGLDANSIAQKIQAQL